MKAFFAMLLAVLPGSVYGQLEDDDILFESNKNMQEWQFHEDAVNIPAYPDGDKLKRLRVDAADSRFRFYVDIGSITIGRDGVVAATVVARSETGVQNVLFEAFNCATREYKTYAYGTSEKKFYELPAPRWKKILQRSGTSMDFRRDLVTLYYCDEIYGPLEKEEIVRRIDNPSDVPDGSHAF